MDQPISWKTNVTLYIGRRGDTGELFIWKEFAPGAKVDMDKIHEERQALSYPVVHWYICYRLNGDEDLNHVYRKDPNPVLVEFVKGHPKRVEHVGRDAIQTGAKYALVLRQTRDEGAYDRHQGGIVRGPRDGG